MSRHNDVRDNVAFSIEIMLTLKVIKFNLKRSYDKQNLTLVVISKARFINETRHEKTC